MDGNNVVELVHKELDKVYAFAEKVRSGEWAGVTGKTITTVINIGIGGSDLGPVMVYEALKPYVQPGLKARFVSNIDPTDVAETTKGVDPETTLFIVASKTFTTLETLTNARLARAWLLNELSAAGAIDDSRGRRADAIAKHFVAVSTALDKVAGVRHRPGQRVRFLGLGGRPLLGRLRDRHRVVVTLGPDNFADFLDGFHAIDEHFHDTELSAERAGADGAAERLVRQLLRGRHATPCCRTRSTCTGSPAYLQQLTMESNGKGVRWDGSR